MRRPLPPATGKVGWVDDNHEYLRINGKVYRLTRPNPSGPAVYELAYFSDEDEWVTRFVSVPKQGWNMATCTCEDSQKRVERRHACKHIRGLLKALCTEDF